MYKQNICAPTLYAPSPILVAAGYT